jgi:hypothetical protein
MKPILAAVVLSLAACGGGAFPGTPALVAAQPDAGSTQTGPGQAAPDAGTAAADAGTIGADAGTATSGGGADAGPATGTDGGATASGSGCGSAAGGAADLFPCDSPWYRDVTSLPVASESASILSEISSRGGWGLSNHFQISFDFSLIHGDASTSRPVYVQPQSASDRNVYYAAESDLVAGGRGWSVPTPAGGQLEGDTSYHCPKDASGVNLEDCHLTVVDDARHLLIELYGASYDDASGAWYATQESVWNLNAHYPSAERGLGCTSANAAGVPLSPGVIGLRETAREAKDNGLLHHALNFILPPDRTRRAFVAPASHMQIENQLLSSGPPYGVRLRLKASFDETRVKSPGGKVLVRTLKRFGMILTDGGQTILTADDESYVKKQDPTLTWSGLLAPLDLDGVQVSDFDVVDYDSSTLRSSDGCQGIDASPLATVTPRGRPGPRLPRRADSPRARDPLRAGDVRATPPAAL